MQPIAIIHTDSSLDWGESQSQILDDMQWLKARGYQVGLIAPLQSQILKKARDLGLDAFAEDITRFNLRGFRAAVAWLKRYRCDIIHTHGSVDHWLFSLAKWQARKKIALVRSVHGYPLPSRDPFTHALFTWLTQRTLVDAELSRATMVRRNRIPVAKIALLAPAVDLEHFNPGNQLRAREQLQLPLNAFLLGTYGVLAPNKGHQHLIAALKQLPDEVVLLIMGEGELKEQLQKQVVDSGLAQRVIFSPVDVALAEWYQSLDVFVFPSCAKEAVPTSILRAMACEVPVIATRVGGIPELLVDGRNGILVDSGDSRELEIVMRRVLSDSRLFRQVASLGINSVRQGHDANLRIDLLAALYHELVEV